MPSPGAEWKVPGPRNEPKARGGTTLRLERALGSWLSLELSGFAGRDRRLGGRTGSGDRSRPAGIVVLIAKNGVGAHHLAISSTEAREIWLTSATGRRAAGIHLVTTRRPASGIVQGASGGSNSALSLGHSGPNRAGWVKRRWSWAGGGGAAHSVGGRGLAARRSFRRLIGEYGPR